MPDRTPRVLTAPLVILLLKIAVAAVTMLLIASLIALARGKIALHGRINMVVFALTMTALLGLEGLARLYNPGMFIEYLTLTDSNEAFRVHLFFAIPSAILLPVLLFTGVRGKVFIHYPLAILFAALWAGTFVTGVFYLPHYAP
jgi:hypothetical protein